MFSIQLLVIHILHSSKSFVSVNQQNVDVVGLTGSRMFIPTRNTSPLTSTLLQSPRKVVLVIIILFCLILLLSILKEMSNKSQEIMYSTFCLVYSILKSLQVVNVLTLVFRLLGMNNWQSFSLIWSWFCCRDSNLPNYYLAMLKMLYLRWAK